MLAVLDRVDRQRFEPIALAPESGRLAEALRRHEVRHIPFHVRDKSGTRLDRESACQNLLCAVESCSPKLLHANSLAMGRLTGALADHVGVPCIAHLRDIINLSRATVDDLNRNRLLLAVSQATKTFHVGQGVDEQRTQVAYNGVDCKLFRPREATGYLKRQLNLPEDSFLVATIGQIALRKGQHVFAEAATLAVDRLPNVHYLIVGERNSQKDESMAYERGIIDRFRESHLRDRLHCLGYRRDVAQLLNEIDLLVHSAHQEPFGRVLLEAAASGVAIVATRVGGTEEILEDGLSARLVAPGKPEALCAAMIELHTDVRFREHLAGVARRHVENRFPIERAAVELTRVWDSLVIGH